MCLSIGIPPPFPNHSSRFGRETPQTADGPVFNSLSDLPLSGCPGPFSASAQGMRKTLITLNVSIFCMFLITCFSRLFKKLKIITNVSAHSPSNDIASMHVAVPQFPHPAMSRTCSAAFTSVRVRDPSRGRRGGARGGVGRRMGRKAVRGPIDDHRTGGRVGNRRGQTGAEIFNLVRNLCSKQKDTMI